MWTKIQIIYLYNDTSFIILYVIKQIYLFFFIFTRENSIFFVECHIYLNTFISLILSFSKCQNRKITFLFSVNLCFLMLSFWGLLILLFLICFFRHFATHISIEYQCVTSNQQDFKKKIMMIVGACIFLVAAAQALPLFFGVTN